MNHSMKHHLYFNLDKPDMSKVDLLLKGLGTNSNVVVMEDL